jgi:hypothetical protein
MPQDNFNPEKEPTPERKWWNVFERRSEFEEPEKEEPTEQQVERAKELKSAAKQRGHFWESFMPSRDDHEEAEEIAPKGEKVRKKWRALLQRKSEKQVEEFKDEEPETIDSYWLAQLMVAERILVLHEQLAHSEPKTDERRQIKTELDVLGLLSEKLSDPEVQVPAEIEDTYRVIVSVLEQGDQEIDIEKLPVIKDAPEQPEPTEQTREQSFKKYGAAVIVALKKAVQGKKAEPEPESVIVQKSPGGGSSKPVTTIKPVGQTPTPHQTPHVAPGILLTSAVVIAELDERKDEEQAQQATQPEQRAFGPIPVAKAAHPEAPTHPRAEIRVEEPPVEKAPVAPEITLQSSDRKFEHMKTEELLQLAQNISLGNGQYLARAYQTGKIDRDGLISILKTAAWGGNYREEYRRRSAEYMRQLTQPLPVAPQPVILPKEPKPTVETTSDTPTMATDATPTSNTPKSPTPHIQSKPLFSVTTVTIICILIIALVLIVLL